MANHQTALWRAGTVTRATRHVALSWRGPAGAGHRDCPARRPRPPQDAERRACAANRQRHWSSAAFSPKAIWARRLNPFVAHESNYLLGLAYAPRLRQSGAAGRARRRDRLRRAVRPRPRLVGALGRPDVAPPRLPDRQRVHAGARARLGLSGGHRADRHRERTGGGTSRQRERAVPFHRGARVPLHAAGRISNWSTASIIDPASTGCSAT